MTNYRRTKLPGATYFFTVNLLERDRTLLTDHIAALRMAVREVKQNNPFHIDAWVVLPDHLHAIWTLPENDNDYSNRWRRIKAHFTKAVPPTENRSKSRQSKGERGIWQRRFWEHFIRDDQDYARHMDYVHINPVKHGHVTHAKDWPYSSFHACVRKGYYPVNWASTIEASYAPGERK